MSQFKFKKLPISVTVSRSHGHYLVSAIYRKIKVQTVTTDAEIFDYCGKDSPHGRCHDARKAAYHLILDAYERIMLSK